MRPWLIAGLVTGAWVVPLVGARMMRRRGSPGQIIAFSLISLAGIVFGLIVGLGAIVDPAAMPVRDLPALLGRCVDAAGRLLEHPIQHWPRILAAILMLGVIVRLVWSWIAVVRDARSGSRIVEAIGREVRLARTDDTELLVVPADQPFAFTVGLRRRRIVVSTSLMGDSLTSQERRAVLAHERAHVQGWHPALLSIGTMLSRAFPFIRPLRTCADHLMVGLEMAADDAAVREVGDPLIVASTLLSLAPFAPKGAVAGMAGTSVEARVERLTRSAGSAKPSTRGAPAWMLRSVGLIVVLLVVIVPTSATALTGSGRAIAIHSACHLPHPI